ncbi:Lycopene beta-cyclase [Pseudovirgaria hyperparasitica]|uniref:Bifunctional lycopene cyclase/phytoene synthase n=1 Tax=Pseudovirgaria hyperparasitica TaxID=470096 RepID=A0A6A6W5H5_9PEZI|nr:Lycopene beta-cyclase [Pseudovirgaria hyperparasitica]KAF2757284.1 Lycopene beta-cyclase [Pseudovirgaria hyperparasitica]
MGWDYAFVHLKYNFPPAIALTLLYRPLLTATDVYKLLFLITIAVVATIPWDSYLIRSNVWTYTDDAVIGWKLFDIPVEEVFFFVIQTYNTSFLYFILSKPTFHSVYLRTDLDRSHSNELSITSRRTIGQVFLAVVIYAGFHMLSHGGTSTYMGLILSWAGPFMLLLWTLAYQMILNLPITNTLIPIGLPTFYLWMVDTFSLKRGTWVISAATKSDLYLWKGLELEEAVFFLITNVMIVFGLLAFDNALAILNTFPTLFPDAPGLPGPVDLVRALLVPTKRYDHYRVKVLEDAVKRLERKSRSFYLASATFQGRLRIDLILLYSYCRVADDLIDNAKSAEEAKSWIHKLHRFLDIAYAEHGKNQLETMVKDEFPASLQLALLHLPTQYLSKAPLYELLKGFEMDLDFLHPGNQLHLPIGSETDLRMYGSRVAGTIAELCIDLVFQHYRMLPSGSQQASIKRAGHQMGIALQLVNIARDIAVDAHMGRVYLPNTWLDELELTPQAVLKNPRGIRVGKLRTRLLDKAFAIYKEEIVSIEQLPQEVRGPMRTAVESYMEIGETLRREGYEVKPGKATVPKLKRIRVAWNAMSGPLSRNIRV